MITLYHSAVPSITMLKFIPCSFKSYVHVRIEIGKRFTTNISSQLTRMF